MGQDENYVTIPTNIKFLGSSMWGMDAIGGLTLLGYFIIVILCWNFIWSLGMVAVLIAVLIGATIYMSSLPFQGNTNIRVRDIFLKMIFAPYFIFPKYTFSLKKQIALLDEDSYILYTLRQKTFYINIMEEENELTV